MEGGGRWTQKDIEMFQRAWKYLEEKIPSIERECENFNQTNGLGLSVTFHAAEGTWGVLEGIRLAEGDKRRAQRISWKMSKGSGAAGGTFQAVSTISDDEANKFGAFAARLVSVFNLKVWRQPTESSEGRVKLRYILKPKFEQFKT